MFYTESFPRSPPRSILTATSITASSSRTSSTIRARPPRASWSSDPPARPSSSATIERREALKTARDAAANDKVLIAGTGVESAIETLRLTEYAYDIGYDVAMVRTPHYYKGQMANPQNMLAFYRFVCDRSPLPVIIYNFPQATGYDIPAELVIELAEHPNLIGIKESSGSIEKVQKMVEGTRHIQRKATVTETFAAVTARMLQAPPPLPPAPRPPPWFPSEPPPPALLLTKPPPPSPRPPRSKLSAR